MLLVTFDKVPKGAKKYFQFKHKLSRKSPELDIKTADDAVKDYAKSLEEADSNVTFTIFDDEDEIVKRAALKHKFYLRIKTGVF